jgi:catechol 2,3-dioxygenase-like lactoylglutathione lyase family enzyme
MIRGAHMILYSKDPDADRAFFRDVLAWPFVDAHDGWLIFAMPPSEIACHPLMNGEKHEIYLMCEDVEAFVADMSAKDHACSEIKDQGWGRLTTLTLPSGGELGVYEPRHPSPLADVSRGPDKSS